MLESLLGKSLVGTPRSMSSISVSKGSSVISSALLLQQGFPQGKNSVHRIYSSISLSLSEQVSHTDAIRGRPVKISIFKINWILPLSEKWLVQEEAEWGCEGEREGFWWGKTKYLDVKINMCSEVGKRILNNCKHTSKYLGCLCAPPSLEFYFIFLENSNLSLI